MAAKMKTTEQFITEVTNKFDNKWLLDRIEYTGRHNKVEVGCKKHGYFKIRPSHLLRGIGCPVCNSKTSEEFINELKELYDDENLCFDKVNYVNATTELEIGCKKHGYFAATPKQLLKKTKKATCCPKCPNKTTSQFIEEVKEKFNDMFIMDRVDYTGSWNKVEIGCKEHGYWKIAPANLLRGQGCPVCRESKGEKLISLFLQKNNIKFTRQKTYKTCKDKRELPFDFFLPSLDILIEYDGEQHYKPVIWFGGQKTLKEIIKRDNIKTQWCKENNVRLIRVSYLDNIEAVLAAALSKTS